MSAITPQTKVLHFCHITNLTGQHFPVKRLSQLARERGMVTIVDGAHAFAHFRSRSPISNATTTARACTSGCWRRTALVSFTCAAIGSRRRGRSHRGAARRNNDIRKFEEIGTIAAAPFAAINEALAYHQAIGVDRKAARLRYLTLRWANRVKDNPRIQMHSSLAAGDTYGLATVGIKGSGPRTSTVSCGTDTHHHHGDHARGLSGDSRDAEHLPRRSRRSIPSRRRSTIC